MKNKNKGKESKNGDLKTLISKMILSEDLPQKENLRKAIKIIQNGGSKSFKSLEQLILRTIKNFKTINRNFSIKVMFAVKKVLKKVKQKLKKVQVKKFFLKCVDYFGYYLCSSNFQIKKIFRELSVFCLQNLPKLTKEEKKSFQSMLNSAQTLAFHTHLRNQELGISVLVNLQDLFPITQKWLLKIMIESKNSNLRKQIISSLDLSPDLIKYFILLVRDNDPEIGKLIIMKLTNDQIDFINLDFECKCHILHYGLLSRSNTKKSLFIDYALKIFEQKDSKPDDIHVSSQVILKNSKQSKEKKFKKKKESVNEIEIEKGTKEGLRESDQILGRLIDILVGLNLEVCFKNQKMNTLLITLMRELFDRLSFEHLQELIVSLLETVFDPHQDEAVGFQSDFQEVLFLLSTLLEYVQNFEISENFPNQILNPRQNILYIQKKKRLERLGKRLEETAFKNLSITIDKNLPPFFKYLEVVKKTLLSDKANLVTKYFSIVLIRFLSPDEISRKKLKNLLKEFTKYIYSKEISLKKCYNDLRHSVNMSIKSNEKDQLTIPATLKYLTSPKIKELCLHYFSYHNFFNTKIFFDFDLLSNCIFFFNG
jgi:hypothetical protein